MKKYFLNNKTMARIAILSVIAFLLMYIDFPIFIAPAFYRFDFSEVVVLIGGFALGPLAAVIIEAFKILLVLLFKGTQTMFVGELSNFLIGLSLVLPATYIYKKHRNRKVAIIGLVIGTILMSISGVILNYYFILPAYITIFNFPASTIIAMAAIINPAVDSLFKMVILCVLPFNLIKGILVSVVTMILYKHISSLLK